MLAIPCKASVPALLVLLGGPYLSLQKAHHEDARRLLWYLLIPTLMQAAKDLGVVVKGVSFHVGSGATDPEAFREAIKLARSAFDAGAGAFLIHVIKQIPVQSKRLCVSH